jgi:thiol-disulfide isomerase/thioredoxin
MSQATRQQPARRQPPAARRQQQQARRRAASRRRLWLPIGLGVVVLVAAVIAVVAGGSSKDPAPRVGVEETRPVQVSGALAPYQGPGTADAAVGQTLPSIHGQSFNGAPVVIEPNGHRKVIVVAAHWCPHCQAELPRLTEYLRQHPAPADLELFVVATDTSSSRPNYPPSEWLFSLGWPTPMLADDEQADAGRALGVSGFPYFVVVDAHGHIVSRTSGEIGADAFAALIESSSKA